MRKNPHAQALGKLGASKGGKARAKKLSKQRRSEISRLAAEARWSKLKPETPGEQKYPTESEVQAAIVQLAKACGAVIYSTSQGYRSAPGGTRCTPGIPDLMLFFPRPKARLILWETKAHNGRRTAAQVRFGDLCEECFTEYGYGGLEEFKARMKAWGLIA